MKLKQSAYAPFLATLINLSLAYVIYMLCRVAYVWENWSLFSTGWDSLSLWSLIKGGLRFDSSAIFFTNTLYVIMMLLPLRVTGRPWWQSLAKWLFVVVNSLAVTINLCDAVYSQYTGRRTTGTFFHEFSNEGNLGSIFFTELFNHWYLLLAGVAMVTALWLLYARPSYDSQKPTRSTAIAKASRWVLLLLMLSVSLIAMRGGTPGKVLRPINLGTANQYVNQPHEAAIVLNTPFSLIRTIGKTTYVDPKYFDQATLDSIYSPLHLAAPSDSMNRKNIVVIIVESFAQEYTGFYNKSLDGGSYKGYTPFIDSLLAVSLSWEHTFANGRKSIDAMPSILASIPMFVEPFYMTGYSLNRVNGLPALLATDGYSSAFFHGAENGSMGFEDFSYSIGFDKYYGRTEYDNDPRFGGEDDFDGTWAIWDEPFLQYFATMMGQMKEPFVTALFTASSHHPFVVPDKYRDIFTEEELPMHKCIRYTDYALRRFFETASKQPWFDNTIFVITNDHTNMSNHAEYTTSMGVYRGILLFFDPSGSLPREHRRGIAQQTDIMPTLLGIVGHGGPYVAFGNDLTQTPPQNSWTINYTNGIYQYLQNDTLVQWDGDKVVGCYNLASDPMMKSPLQQDSPSLTRHLKAIIQQYMARMADDRLVEYPDIPQRP